MAATYRTSAAGGGTSGTGNRTCTITPAVGDLLVVFVSASGNTNVSPTCSDDNGSGTYDRILSGLWSSSANSFSCFVRTALMVNTTSTVVTVATGSNTAAEIVVVAMSGMVKTGSGAVRSSGKQENQAASTTPAPALNQNALTTNPTLAAVASGDTTTSPNASWTERQDVSQATPTTALEVCTRDSGFTSTTITFGATQSTVFGSMAIELNGDNEGASAITITGASTNPNAAGQLERLGDLASALAGATTSAAGTVDVRGASAPTLDAATIASAGTVDVQGAATPALAAVGVSAAGTVETFGTEGAAAIDLDAVTAATAGTVDVQGASASTLAGASAGAEGQLERLGDASPALDAATVSGAGTVDVQGAAVSSLTGTSVAAEGQLERLGDANLTPVASLAAEGIVDVQGAAAPALAGAVATAAGGVLLQGASAPALAGATAAATGTGPYTEGALAITLEGAEVWDGQQGALGTVDIFGALARTVSAALSATGEVSGAGDIPWQEIVLDQLHIAACYRFAVANGRITVAQCARRRRTSRLRARRHLEELVADRLLVRVGAGVYEPA